MKRHDPLRDAIDALPREVAPRRDLWPRIDARLGEQQTGDRRSSRRAWRPAPRALAACGLAAAAVLALLLLPRPPAEFDEDFFWQGSALAALEQGYAQVRADAMDVLSTHCDEHAAAGCADLRTGLADLDHSVQELKLALGAAPAGSAVGQWLAQRLQRNVSQVRGLSHLASGLF